MDSKVCVLGSINMDVIVRVASFPARGETVSGLSCDLMPGGKGANQAIAAANMGVPVDLIGAIGDDEFGRLLHEYLAASGVGIGSVVRVPGPSGTALVTVAADGQNQIVVVPGANDLVPREVVESYFRTSNMALRCVVAQFEVPVDLIADVFGRAKALGATTVLNPSPTRPLPPALVELTDIVVLNEVERAQITASASADLSPNESARLAVDWAQRIGGKTVVVTLGAQGLVAVDRGRVIRQPAPVVAEVVDTTGAGDCFCGVLVAFLAKGFSLEDSLSKAQRAAALSVQKVGASPSFPRLGVLATLAG